MRRMGGESFIGILNAVTDAWITDRASLLEGGERLSEAIRENAQQKNSVPDAPFDEAVQSFRDNFDEEFGGFGNAPKFPSPHTLMFLLHKAPELAQNIRREVYVRLVRMDEEQVELLQVVVRGRVDGSIVAKTR